MAAAQAMPSAEEIASYEAALQLAAQQNAAEQEAMQAAFAKEQADLQEAQARMQEKEERAAADKEWQERAASDFRRQRGSPRSLPSARSTQSASLEEGEIPASMPKATAQRRQSAIRPFSRGAGAGRSKRPVKKA